MAKHFGQKEMAKAQWRKDSLALDDQDATYTNKAGQVVPGRKFSGAIVLPSGEYMVIEIYQKMGSDIVKQRLNEEGNVMSEVIWLNISIKGGVK